MTGNSNEISVLFSNSFEGHVVRSSGAVRTACDIQIDGRRGAGRPKLTWKKLIEKDCHEWKLMTVDPQKKEHLEIRYEICYASSKPLPGRGPLMWMMPLHINQKSDYDDDMILHR